MSPKLRIERQLHRIYGDRGASAFERLMAILTRFEVKARSKIARFSENDIVFITYGNTLRCSGERPLQTLHRFAAVNLKSAVSTIHLLPFFPFSSDDGFSVIDYERVDPSIGMWEDISRLGGDFDLMFDFVLNHISAQSPWFDNYLKGLDGYRELAIEVDPQTDLSAVVRPRTHPLLTPYTKFPDRKVFLWTTFSADQIDLKYNSIDVLCRMVDVLLSYVGKGARFIRMDAVAYVWKEVGTDCIHRPQAHALVKLFRAVLDMVAPDVAIITETNVPHDENIRYFGNGFDEAQMVYNFSLPPLLAHTFLTSNTDYLCRWASQLATPSSETTFLNFTASHDGIGTRPLEGILSEAQIQDLIQHARHCGGDVSSKRNSDGSRSPYELNITYVDMMGRAGQGGTLIHAQRFLASQAIALSLPGVPAVYVHSLLGSRNWNEGILQTGRLRTINRQPLDIDRLQRELDDSSSFRSMVFRGYSDLLRTRRKQPAFHPNAVFEVLELGSGLFGVRRSCEAQTIYALTAVSEHGQTVSLSGYVPQDVLTDLVTGRAYPANAIALAPYQTVWLVLPSNQR